MRALVTGGAGFVGTNLIKRLLKDGHEVISVDNYSTGFKDNHQDGCKYYNIDLVNKNFWNLSNTCQCEVSCDCTMEDVDVVFHLAALARIQPSIINPHKSIYNNFIGTLNVFEYARDKDIPLVYAGSSSKHHAPYGSPYAWSKYSGEQICKLYSECYDLPTIICRFYNVYGPYQILDGAYAAVIGIFEEQYQNKKPLTITGDGEQRRDFTHVDDIVDGLVRSFRAMHGEVDMRFAGEEFELGRGKNYSINEVANMFGEDYPKEYIPPRKGEYDKTLCVDNKAQELLGWKPTKDLTNHVQLFLESKKH